MERDIRSVLANSIQFEGLQTSNSDHSADFGRESFDRESWRRREWRGKRRWNWQSRRCCGRCKGNNGLRSWCTLTIFKRYAEAWSCGCSMKVQKNENERLSFVEAETSLCCASVRHFTRTVTDILSQQRRQLLHLRSASSDWFVHFDSVIP